MTPRSKLAPPVADFGLSRIDPAATEDVRLYDFSYDPGGIGISIRSWDFGDGDGSTRVSPQHRFDSGGVYEIRLAVTTFDGRESSTVRAVQVRPVVDGAAEPGERDLPT
jgi:PKD repeat protein